MRAVRYHGPRQPFRLEEVAAPEPKRGEVLVRIRAAGICHTELHFESGLLDLGVSPLIMGHEIAGIVDQVGEGVSSRSVGERVVLYYYAGCGGCEWCRRGDENLCGQPKAEYGFFHDGGYAEYIAVPERNAVVLPDSISFEEAAPIGCAVTTALHACNLADVRAGEVVVVYGVGAVGFGLIQAARLRGARVVAIGRTERKLKLAQELGADHTIDASGNADVAGAVQEWTEGRGAHVVFELVATRETMAAATGMLAKRGRLVFIGYSEDSLSVHPLQLVIGEGSVMGSVGNTLEESQEAVRLVGEGKVRTVVDRVLPLERFEEGLQGLRQGDVTGRVVLRP